MTHQHSGALTKRIRSEQCIGNRTRFENEQLRCKFLNQLQAKPGCHLTKRVPLGQAQNNLRTKLNMNHRSATLSSKQSLPSLRLGQRQ